MWPKRRLSCCAPARAAERRGHEWRDAKSWVLSARTRQRLMGWWQERQGLGLACIAGHQRFEQQRLGGSDDLQGGLATRCAAVGDPLRHIDNRSKRGRELSARFRSHPGGYGAARVPAACLCMRSGSLVSACPDDITQLVAELAPVDGL